MRNNPKQKLQKNICGNNRILLLLLLFFLLVFVCLIIIINSLRSNSGTDSSSINRTNIITLLYFLVI